MSNKHAIIDKILKNEKAVNERWNVGDYFGFLDCYIDDVTFVDPGVIVIKNIKKCSIIFNC